MTKIVGILGGMGPLSTVELMRKVILYTPARVEQEHIRMLVDNRPQIPDRSAYILGKGSSPLPMLQESARLLEKWGAEFVSIPCNTAHIFIDEIRRSIKIPLLDMLLLLSQKLEKEYSSGAPVGLLTTNGALRSKLFEKYLKRFTLVLPSARVQEYWVMAAVYGEQGIKSGGELSLNRTKILKAIESLEHKEPAVVVAGCTEVGLAVEGASVRVPVVNPLDILAREIVRQVSG